MDAVIPESSANLHNIVPIRDRVRLEVTDVRSTEMLRDCLGVRIICSISPDSRATSRQWRTPLTDLDTNCRAQLALLELCRQINPGIAIVFASTRQIYGKPLYLPVDERHPLSPVDVNGVSKLGGETIPSALSQRLWNSHERAAAHQHLRPGDAHQGRAPDLCWNLAAQPHRGRAAGGVGRTTAAGLHIRR